MKIFYSEGFGVKIVTTINLNVIIFSNEGGVVGKHHKASKKSIPIDSKRELWLG